MTSRLSDYIEAGKALDAGSMTLSKTEIDATTSVARLTEVDEVRTLKSRG